MMMIIKKGGSNESNNRIQEPDEKSTFTYQWENNLLLIKSCYFLQLLDIIFHLFC